VRKEQGGENIAVVKNLPAYARNRWEIETSYDVALSAPEQCPYLADREMQLAHFFTASVSAGELDRLLSRGWRKFGMYYFRPACRDCTACVPLRIPVKKFAPTKSQQRAARRNKATGVSFGPLDLRDEVYDVYREHSVTRFNKKTSTEDFYDAFYFTSCPALQSEYFTDGSLGAVGFIDVSSHALSSVYFAYRDSFRRLAPGVFSVLAEVDYARNLGKDYYYLGYWIADNHHMAYKNNFRPNEKMDWRTGAWGELGEGKVSGG
jgi:arginyl-tRNA--protein-N-Asp/Glu arginylyltransferase